MGTAAQAAPTDAFDSIPMDDEDYRHQGPKDRPDVKLPLTAAGATGVAAPINVTRKTGLNALNLGDDMNDFDNFEAAEDYDYTYLPGKDATAVRAEQVLATEMHQKAASEMGLRARMGLGVLGGVGKLPEGAAKFASTGNRLPASRTPAVEFDAFAADDVLAGLDIDADIDAIAAALYQEEGVTPYEQPTAASAMRPVTSQAPARQVDYFSNNNDLDAYSDDGALHPKDGPSEEEARPVTVQPTMGAALPLTAPVTAEDAGAFEELQLGNDDWDFGDLATEAFVMRGARQDVTKEEFDQNVEGLFDDVELD
eukprot:GDKJ01013612.1.p1 GENE.GDKJ01013612.1~~GDKJ01013612.1.p1  ORF type:complete len:311 (-),score=45.10 GDKJ01013612.1:71-1003(-)